MAPATCIATVVCCLVLAAEALADGMGSPGPIAVELRKVGDGWQLYRGGQPYFIKGAVYWADPQGRFPLSGLASRGGNSVRCGGGNVSKILDAAQELGVSVTVGLPVRMEYAHKFDYDDEAAVKEQFERMKAMVLQFKDHPALLMWGVGNELSLFYTNKKVWDAVNDIAEMIHAVDGRHPTMTVIGDSPAYKDVIPEIRARCPAIDVLGINSYGGIELVPQHVREAGWDRPYCMTEWGPSGHWQVPRTKWKAPIEETSSEKALLYQQRYENTMLKDPQHCLGSYVFFWQWRQETTHTWYGMFLETGERTEAVNVMQYLWTGKWPDNRAPRIASLRIDGLAATDSVYVKPGSIHVAAVAVDDPEGDALSFNWEIVPEVKKGGYAGAGEKRPSPIPNLFQSAAGKEMSFVAPQEPGPYRAFVFVLDGHGNAATANIPFYVQG